MTAARCPACRAAIDYDAGPCPCGCDLCGPACQAVGADHRPCPGPCGPQCANPDGWDHRTCLSQCGVFALALPDVAVIEMMPVSVARDLLRETCLSANGYGSIDKRVDAMLRAAGVIA